MIVKLRTKAWGTNAAVYDCYYDCGERTAHAVVEARGDTTVYIRSMQVPSKAYALSLHREIRKYFKDDGFKALQYDSDPGITTEPL